MVLWAESQKMERFKLVPILHFGERFVVKCILLTRFLSLGNGVAVVIKPMQRQKES